MFGLDSGQLQDCKTVKPAKTGIQHVRETHLETVKGSSTLQKVFQEKRQCIELKGERPPKEDSTAEGKRWM